MKPSVSVVVPTMNRPELVRLAIKSIRDQDYDGVVEAEQLGGPSVNLGRTEV